MQVADGCNIFSQAFVFIALKNRDLALPPPRRGGWSVLK
jgi:hypothetical protein